MRRFSCLGSELVLNASLCRGSDPMLEATYNVLFLCTANSARSILAEAILNQMGGGLFKAFSAGSHPRGSVNPYALNLLHLAGHDVSQVRSKSWDEFVGPDATRMAFVFTVC